MASQAGGAVSSDTGHGQQVQAPPKFSRYRSVRRAAEARDAGGKIVPTTTTTITAGASSSSAHPPLPTGTWTPASPPKTQNPSIKRSMSRYRNAKPGATKVVTSVPPPPIPKDTSNLPSRPRTQGNGYSSEHATVSNWVDRSAEAPQPPVGNNRPSNAQSQTRSRSPEYLPDDSRSPEAPPRKSQSTMRSTRKPSKPVDIDTTRANARFGDMLRSPRSPFRNKSPEYRTSSPATATDNEFAAHEKATAKYNATDTKASSIKQGGGLLSRMKDGGTSSKVQRGRKDTLKNMISSPVVIDQAELNVVPADDTPISAVNAGERRVLVTCNDSFITLPVTPTTTSKDILCSAANCLSEKIPIESSILLEYFRPLGLERPLRKYEHVRDVMNSWDNDNQNQLIIVPASDDYYGLDELDAKYAPRKQPSDSTFYLYYSQQNEKWNKRWITLRSDGQVLLAKKEGGETTNICHISDFDIYTPTRRRARKMKQPKKICFAVKSQQKSIMFINSGNFVHYFSTNHQDIAVQFHRAVHQWRSWYLANVLGGSEEGDAKDKATSKSQKATGSQPRPSLESRPYQLGSFKPLLDGDISEWSSEPNSPAQGSPLNPIASPTTTSGRNSASGNHTTQPLVFSAKSKDAEPKASKTRGRSKTTTDASPSENADIETFSPNGLLGRTYTERKKVLQEQEEKGGTNSDDKPFLSHGLLNNINTASQADWFFSHPGFPGNTPSRTNTVRDRNDSDRNSNLSRSKSVRQKPKPLVDLTPAYQEPPQHSRKGRGVTMGTGKPLVEGATGPELQPGAIQVPSATTWRRPTQRSGTVSSQASDTNDNPTSIRSRSNTIRSVRRQQPQHDPAVTSPTSQTFDSPFLPNGLLARNPSTKPSSKNAWSTGRGVATGDRNVVGKPMLDLTEPSQFAQGSLLRNVEAYGGDTGGRGNGPIIDRERRVERSVFVGEGY